MDFRERKGGGGGGDETSVFVDEGDEGGNQRPDTQGKQLWQLKLPRCLAMASGVVWIGGTTETRPAGLRHVLVYNLSNEHPFITCPIRISL